MNARALLLASPAILALVFSLATSRAESDTPLEKQMQTLARGMRQLSATIADPAKQQENIALLESLRKAVSDSLALEPQKTATVKAADREAFLAAYRDQMQKLGTVFAETEESLKSGAYDRAKTSLNAVGPIKKEGHSRFKLD
jgi:soluble cytochrome b562